MNIRSKLEKRMPWSFDIGSHPDAAFLPEYDSGRCQNPVEVVCPYCGAKHEPWEVLDSDECDGSAAACQDCDREFVVDSSFGYGFSTKPKKCRSGHNYVFASQYFYDGDSGDHGWVRIFRCTICSSMDYNRVTGTPLAWRDKYDDPEFFDPDGILDTGTTLAEKIKDRQGDQRTPVLDWLREVSRAQRYSRYTPALLSGAVAALSKHDAIYSASEEVS